MRTGLIVLLVVLIVGAPAASVVAQDAETLRRELDQMRHRFEELQQEHRKALEQMAERLQRLEAGQQTAAPPPVVVQAPPASQPLRLEDLARPRQPFSLYGQRGPGQLLFDIGIVSDFVGNITQGNVDKADAGTFAGRENRFFPREIEVNLFGRIDPYAEGVVRFEFAEEFEDGARVLETKLAEGYLSLLTLPFGTKLSLGLQAVQFGLLSHLHREALPQPDTPQVLLRFLGEEQFRETGAQLSWVAPFPFFLEGVVGVFNGDNEVAFGRGSLRHPLLTGRVRTFFDLDRFGAFQLGGSAAAGWATQDVTVTDAVTPATLELADNHRSILAGFDAKYKYTPEGWRHALLTLAGEALLSRRRATVVGDPDGDGVESVEQRTRNRFGWYAYAEVQPWRRWLGGVRYDNTQFPVNPGREWAVEPYIAFAPSEFLRFRLAYKHTERSHREGFTDNGGSARLMDELLFQATFFLGAHPAHPF
jgi:hypothetical protein